jgi:arylsulfatase A-like enzyme
MMTGRLPVRVGVIGKDWAGGVLSAAAVGGLPQNETTLAEALKAGGYNTGRVGHKARVPWLRR